MRFDPILADIRFGCGLSPGLAPAQSPEALLDTLDGPDKAAQRFEIEPFPQFQHRLFTFDTQAQARRDARGTDKEQAATDAQEATRQQSISDQVRWFGQHLMRRTWSPQPFRERLAFFWADHFTASGKTGVRRAGTSPYIESAIRPHMSGLFEDLLIATVMHPLMVYYLDQRRSVGPNSPHAAKGKTARGLNENLAREVMELHTLGVNGPYTQTDVRELAKLFTGVTLHPRTGIQFREDFAEPGAETVLGRTYGGGDTIRNDIEAALRDLARHPATARHIAGKLAMHFVSDSPDADLVAALEQRFVETRGDLRAVYGEMLRHPASMQTDQSNVKQPMDFIGSTMRALAVPPNRFDDWTRRRMLEQLIRPLGLMGQTWELPDGPDGLDEDDAAWITPQGLAARLQWAVTVPQMLRPDLPDPRDFVETALGPRATPTVQFAASAAESRSDGVGIILASPAFQRM
ncbi:DUF1800 family protein [Puniceibacterium sp. IMCC21224]|uniref:DUF1800 domain-containing protein n=1 Tax=Puniceibacterium sp. IMCC21224 TaxID=1618204 RepID=UPI00064DAFD5|nr:DUF1800 domain-containing protein [Puniceibacterium sp. IMCC21224]KMK65797.1 hypothetical protein IMCC21224_11633 [Puniceibacterium sp. IMCC21224]